MRNCARASECDIALGWYRTYLLLILAPLLLGNRQGTFQHSSKPPNIQIYDDWLPLWKRHLSATQLQGPPLIPLPAERHTPLIVENWNFYLQNHPNQELIHYFLDGLTARLFRIAFSTPATLHPAKKNTSSAMNHPSVVDDSFKLS